MEILGYDCVTAAGFGVDSLMKELFMGRDCSRPLKVGEWGIPEAMQGGRFCAMDVHAESAAERIISVAAKLAKNLPRTEGRSGLILASTKGAVEDFVWKISSSQSRYAEDPMVSLLPRLQNIFQTQMSCVVSNACSSTHVALEFLQDLFATDQLDSAVVVATDVIGPFVYRGFTSLKVLSRTKNRPFDRDRDGLQLGEAVVLFVVQKNASGGLRIVGVNSDTEGTSITRPSVNGKGLLRVIEKLPNAKTVDLVVAHGTGTRFNDQAEDLALSTWFAERIVPVTNTKWCIGHTLGASGAVDLISACEMIRRQETFALANTANVDPEFKMKYLTSGRKQKISRIMTTSLGFGGVHAALMLEAPR